MKKFDTQYVDSNTYPIRLDTCLENLCSQVGLTLGNKNFPNNSYMLKGNPFTNKETRKTVLSNLVQLAGGFAEIDVEDGKLYVRNLDVSGEAVETIDGNNYDEFKPNNVFGPVNSVRIQMNSGVDGEETIKEAEGVTDENRCQITIADNYYLTSAEEREAVINGIFNALNGLTYLPIELSYYGYPWLKLGDKIKVKDKNDKEYITYVMEHTLKYNGSYSGIIKAIALTKTQQAYKEVLSLKDWRRNTELAVDKINGKMTAVIEEQSEQSEKLTKVEQDVNGITSKVSSVEQSVENITKIEGTAEGKNIYIDDASAEPLIDIMLEGESRQIMRSGKNYFDASQIPSSTNIVVSDNGKTITMPIATSGVGYTSTTKKLSELCPKLKVGDTATLRFNRNLGTTKNMFIYLNLVKLTWGINNPKAITQEMLDSNVALYANRYNDGETGQCILTDFSIMLSSETDTSWEQYGASPSPVYPSKIENLEGENICPSLNTTRTINGVTFTKNKDGSITMNGTATAKTTYPINVNTTTNTRTVLLKANSKYRMLSSYESGKYTTQVFYLKNNAITYTSSLIETVEETKAGMYIRVYKNAVLENVTIYPQITKGEEYKPYVPYNSLGFLDIGENLIKAREYSATVNNVERSITNGLVKLNGTLVEAAAGSNAFSIIGNWTANYSAYDTSIEYIKLKAGTYTLSIHNVKGSCTEGSLALVAGNTNPKKTKAKIQLKNETSKTFTLEEESICRISVEYNVGCTFNNFEFNVMLNKGSQAPYIPYQEQAEYFPLSKGQKLMEGSYLADDGIHHVRKQVVLTGTENWNLYLNQTKTFMLSISPWSYSGVCTHYQGIISSFFDVKAGIYLSSSAMVIISDPRFSTVEEFKTYLAEQYSAGTPVTFEYIMITNNSKIVKKIVPYTDDQKEAWEKLRHFTLFRGINNITSTANAKITYVRDNGLSDTYETKRNVKENHYTKSETDSQISQTADLIKESVKSINEQTQEKLATLELANQSLGFATKRTGGNNLVRNSAMINDNNFWLAHAKYPYQESDIPPDNPAEGTYWYCTANSGSYIENQMYVYNSGWKESELSRKSLLSAQNYFAYTTSSEYWANGKNANENTLSGRVIKLDGRQDYTVSHIFNITEPITLNQNENELAISYFIKNSIVQGNVCVGLMFLNEADFTEVEKPYSLYEPGIILTPDDLKDLTKIEQIIEIPKKSDFIPVVVSNTAPTDTTKNWLDTTIYLPKKYNSQTSQWEILDTKMSLYNESSREVWTYRYFYGFYYQTPIIYDTAEIKSCYVALTFYPAFAVYTGNVEPTPYKGLYWNNKTTNLVKRAKYNNTTFVEWETLDIPSSLLPTGTSLGVELFDYIVPIKGFVEIADLKLEYNTICTQWTQFPGEVYGKNYKMDEKGFWIQANQNTMFIDEDEILATYKGINIFQINKDLAYFYKIQATESIEIGNYFLKTQQINSKNMLLLY